MALFGRGNDPATILKKLENRGWKDPAEKRELLALLAEAGDLATPSVVRFLTSGDADLQRFALDRMGGTARDPRLLDALMRALPGTPRPRWRPLIAALQRLESDRLPVRLAQMMRSKTVEQRALALEIYAGLPDWKSHLPLLKGALRDDDPSLRVRAIQVLGQDAHDPLVRPLLCELMFSTDETCRHESLRVLARAPDVDIIEDFFDLLAGQPDDLQDAMLRGLRRLLAASQNRVSDSVLDRMLPLLAADDKRIRESAAQLLAAMPDTLHVLRRFLQYAKGIAFWLRDRAFRAVQTVADDVVEPILALLVDEDADVVVGAVVMAAHSRDPRLFRALVDLLDSDLDWWIKVPTLETLVTFPHEGIHDLLVGKLHDPELGPAAIACLGLLSQPQGLPHLVRLLDSKRRGLRRAALRALDNYRDPVLLPTLERVASQDSDEECRVTALEMLDEYGAEGVSIAASIRGQQAAEAPAADEGLTLTMERDDTSDAG